MMRAMIFNGVGRPLREEALPRPELGPGQVRLHVQACAVCRTDCTSSTASCPTRSSRSCSVTRSWAWSRSAEADRDSRSASVSACPGSAGPTGRVVSAAPAGRISATSALFTGYQLDGGFAEETVADERYCLRIPESYSDLQAAPLLCAGLIGYRSLVMTGRRSASACTGSVRPPISSPRWRAGRDARVFAFTRAGDEEGQRLRARSERNGRGARPRSRLRCSTQRSSSRRSARSFRRVVCGRQGRRRRLRRDPHERYPFVLVRPALGRASAPLGRKPHSPGRGGVHGARSAGPGPDGDPGVSSGRGERSASAPARRRARGAAVLKIG